MATLEKTKNSNFLDNLKKINNVVSAPKLRALLVLVLLLIMTPSYGSAFSYYFTEFLKFDAVLMGQIAFLSSLAYLFGIFMVNSVFAGVSFKNFYSTTTIISALLNALSLVLLFRVNVKLGISDEFFCMSNSALGAFISELNFLPVLAFTCRLCPVGLEGTTYAVFTAIMNLAWYMSTLLGSILIWAFGVTKHDFSKLWILVVIQVVYILIFGIIVGNF